jgi:hypothetical protein
MPLRQPRGIFLVIASARGCAAFQFHQALGDKDNHLARQISVKEQPVIASSRTHTMRWGTSPPAWMARHHGEVIEAESFVRGRWEPTDKNSRKGKLDFTRTLGVAPMGSEGHAPVSLNAG